MIENRMKWINTFFNKCNLILYVVIIAIIIISNNNFIIDSYAHQEFHFGNITLEPGWSTEPPLQNEITEIELIVTNNDKPVRNALKDMDVTILYGGIKKSISFVPSEVSAGVYHSQIIPSRLGSYSLEFNGKIEDQSIKSILPIEDVEDKKMITFPITENQVESNDFLGKQIRPIINDINNQVNDINTSINSSNSLIMETANNYNSLSKELERTNLIVYITLGLGISGIIVGIIILERKLQGI
ncbi:MAG: hypothetical protein ACXW2E_10930 [Nitrososphaeraceae archaeon]